MLIRQEQRLKVLIVSWNEKWVSSEVYVFAPMNLAFCGYLLLLACSVRKRSHLSERGGMWQQKKSTSGVAKLLCFDVLQTVLKHAVSKLKHVTQVHAVHNKSRYRGFALAFLLLINKSVFFKICAVSKFTLFTVWLLLVSFKREKKTLRFFGS